MSYATSIDSLLSASPTGDYKSIFSTFALDGSAVYNTNLWGGGGATLDWTGIIWNDDGLDGYALLANGVAITKRHVIITNHGGHAVGVNVTWIKANGATVTRNLEAGVTDIGGSGESGMRVLYLDADLPSGVAIYPIFARPAVPVDAPAIKLDQENKALIADVSFASTIFGMAQPIGTRLTYYEASISGDSGSPALMLLGTQLVYLGHITAGGGGAGLFAGYYHDEILAACASLDAAGDQTGYKPAFLSRVPQSTPTLSIGVGL